MLIKSEGLRCLMIIVCVTLSATSQKVGGLWGLLMICVGYAIGFVAVEGD